MIEATTGRDLPHIRCAPNDNLRGDLMRLEIMNLYVELPTS